MNTGLLSETWKDVLLIVSTIILVTWAIWAAPQRSRRVLHWLLRINQITVRQPHTGYLVKNSAIVHVCVIYNTALKPRRVSATLLDLEGQYRRPVAEVLPSKGLIERAASPYTYEGEHPGYSKHEWDWHRIRVDSAERIEGLLEMEFMFVGDQEWRTKTYRVPVTVEPRVPNTGAEPPRPTRGGSPEK